MEPAALLKPSGKNVASVNHFCGEKKILLEPGITATSRRTSDHISWAAELSMCTHERGAAQDGAVDTDRQAPWGNRGGCEVARSALLVR